MSITTSTIGKRTYKMVLLGDTATGKTSLIERFVNNKFEERDNPTIGIDFVGKNVSYNQVTCRLQLWDTAGQERYRSLIPSYLKDAICAIFVFDSTRPQTLRNVETWIELFRQNRGEKSLVALCANKTDLQKAYEVQEAKKLLEKYNMPFYEVSAKKGSNVDEMFMSLVEKIMKMMQKKKKKIEDQELFPPLTTETLKTDSSEHGSDKKKNIKLESEGQTRRSCC